MEMNVKTVTAAGFGAAAVALGLAGSAAAHITASPDSSAAGEFARLEFGVPHGCEGSPTTRVRIRIPETVPSVTPQRNPLWDLSTKEGRKQRTELHGETITRGVSEVIWTAKQPLADDQLDALGMSVMLPDAAGETVYFPAIQQCEQGEHRWIQIPADGESAHELEEPAPQVELTAGGADHGSGGTEEGEEAGSGGDDGDDGAPMWLAIGALGVGALGLVTGASGLWIARRPGG